MFFKWILANFPDSFVSSSAKDQGLILAIKTTLHQYIESYKKTPPTNPNPSVNHDFLLLTCSFAVFSTLRECLWTWVCISSVAKNNMRQIQQLQGFFPDEIVLQFLNPDLASSKGLLVFLRQKCGAWTLLSHNAFKVACLKWLNLYCRTSLVPANAPKAAASQGSRAITNFLLKSLRHTQKAQKQL